MLLLTHGAQSENQSGGATKNIWWFPSVLPYACRILLSTASGRISVNTGGWIQSVSGCRNNKLDSCEYSYTCRRQDIDQLFYSRRNKDRQQQSFPRQEMEIVFGVHVLQESPYLSKMADGKSEVGRFNRSILKSIRASHNEGKYWKQELYWFIRSYINTLMQQQNKHQQNSCSEACA